MKRIIITLAILALTSISWCETSSVLHWSSMTALTTEQIEPPATAVPHRITPKKLAPATKKVTPMRATGKLVIIYIADANKCPACHTDQTLATIEYLKKQHGAKVITIKPDKNGNWIMPRSIQSFPSYAIYENSRLIHVQSTGNMIEFEAALAGKSEKKSNGPFRTLISK